MTSSTEVSLPSSCKPLTPASDIPDTSAPKPELLLPFTTISVELSEPPGVPVSCVV